MSKQLRLDVAQLTDVGRKRPHNEDNMAYVIPRDSQVMAKKGALFIVADGMGGHAAGEVASEIAVDTVSNVYYQDEADDIPLSLMNAIKRANALIHQRAAENMMRSGMGTTCVAAVLRGGVAYIANVGDSRAYMVRHGQARQISQDHSWVEEQVRAGLLTKDQARSHAQRNVITRALGTQAEVEVDVFTELLEDGDTFVLCSDGLSGPVGEEDLRAIVNQYMPQESVYHLVERANENGGADNITAIVVRVMEAGDDVPAALQHPVHVGGGNHVADESTAVLGRVPSSSLGVSTPPRVEDGRINSRPLPPAEPAFISSKGYTAPHAAVNVPRRKRNRLLLPTILVAILLIVALAGAGAWYFLKPSAVQTTLNNADALIAQAKSKVSSQPDQALSNLTQAQQELRSLKGASLNPQQSDQLTSLQNNLTSEFKMALTNYNQRSLAVGLPCVNQAPVTLNAGGSDIQTSSLATLQTDKDHTVNYVLGLDGAVYQVNDQHTLQKVPLGNDKIILLTSDNQNLYTLTSAPPDSNYRLHAYKWQNNKLTEKVNNGTAIKPELITNQTPLLLTAWAGEVYVISASSQANQNQATLLNYNVDKLDKDPATTQISISAGLVSAAALPNGQLFLLHSDGKIASLQANSPKALEAGVLVQQTVNTPWYQDAQNFNVATPVATPTAPISKFLSIPPPTAQTRQSLLSVGIVNKTAHLFVVDNTNHRVLNFVVKAPNSVATSATPTASATANSMGGSVIAPDSNLPSASLEQQYVSSTLISGVKGTAFDARANHVNLLAAAPNSAATNQIVIDVSSTTACRPNP